MKLSLFLAVFLTTNLLFADSPVAPPIEDPKNPLLECVWDPSRVDAHAPIGVMADHNHEAGEFMVSYRYMVMNMDSMRSGTNSLTAEQVFDLGFPVTPTQMRMEMHMAGLMFAPSDWLTLLAMGGYTMIEMDHVTRPGSPPRALRGERFTTRGESWSDTTLGGLIKFLDADCARAHFLLGVSAPTGSIDEEDPSQLPYAMQTGSGTWDIVFGPTYLRQHRHWSWGIQGIGKVRLGENDRGYTLGDRWTATTWAAMPLTDGLSLSGRIGWQYDGAIEGADAALNPNLVPTSIPANYERQRIDGAVGLNWLGQRGFLQGHRLALEAALPIYEETGGPILETDYWFIVGWQKAF